jgi:alcohol dehydrogenase
MPDTSLYRIPDGADEEALVMLSDILPTGFECGVLITAGRGVDTTIEAVGVPATFVLCEDIVAPGGTIANVGVHGIKADLHLERLWSQNITITTRLVDTVTMPMLLKTVQSKKLDPTALITHRFTLDHILDAYETFSHAAGTGALKVIIAT